MTMLQQKRAASTQEESAYILLRNISAEEEAEPEEGDAPLADTARMEREYVRRRLHEELKREPTEEEVDEWLRRHTEGY